MRLELPGIRLRLTLWYAAVLLFILACVSTGVYVFVRANLERTLRTQLDRDIDTVATVVAASPRGKGPNGHLRGDVLFAVTDNQREHRQCPGHDDGARKHLVRHSRQQLLRKRRQIE